MTRKCQKLFGCKFAQLVYFTYIHIILTVFQPEEALNRLYSCLSEATPRATPKASLSAALSPKETKLVLVAEFILFTKSKLKRLSSVQELQLMQVITDLFRYIHQISNL